jgi:hypothetical protein
MNSVSSCEPKHDSYDDLGHWKSLEFAGGAAQEISVRTFLSTDIIFKVQHQIRNTHTETLEILFYTAYMKNR